MSIRSNSASNRVASATPSGRAPAARINLLYVASGMSASDARIASNASKATRSTHARRRVDEHANVPRVRPTRPSSSCVVNLERFSTLGCGAAAHASRRELYVDLRASNPSRRMAGRRRSATSAKPWRRRRSRVFVRLAARGHPRRHHLLERARHESGCLALSRRRRARRTRRGADQPSASISSKIRHVRIRRCLAPRLRPASTSAAQRSTDVISFGPMGTPAAAASSFTRMASSTRRASRTRRRPHASGGTPHAVQTHRVAHFHRAFESHAVHVSTDEHDGEAEWTRRGRSPRLSSREPRRGRRSCRGTRGRRRCTGRPPPARSRPRTGRSPRSHRLGSHRNARSGLPSGRRERGGGGGFASVSAGSTAREDVEIAVVDGALEDGGSRGWRVEGGWAPELVVGIEGAHETRGGGGGGREGDRALGRAGRASGLDGPPASPGSDVDDPRRLRRLRRLRLPRLGAGGPPGALSSEGDARTPRGVAREAAPSSGARGASGTRAGARGPDEEEDHAPTRARANDADAADDAIAACAIDRREGRLGRVRATRVVVRVETRQPRTSKPSDRTRHVAVTAPRIRASASRLKKPPSARCPSPSTRPPQRAWSQRNSLQSTLLLKRVPDFKDDTSYE